MRYEMTPTSPHRATEDFCTYEVYCYSVRVSQEAAAGRPDGREVYLLHALCIGLLASH